MLLSLQLVLYWQYQVSMQEEPPRQERDSRSSFYTFDLGRTIKGWQDFLTVLRPACFEESLNQASEEELEHFWMRVLQEMVKEREKICLLVPVEIRVDPAKRTVASEAVQEESKQIEVMSSPTKAKERPKQKEKKKEIKVPLSPKVRETAMRLLDKHFPSLSYDYASLFLGNPKQLLIYRRCYAIESYIEKYRLPKDFKEKFSQLEYLTDEYYTFKVQRNRAISTFNEDIIDSFTQKITKSTKEIKMAIDIFSSTWKTILEDFHLHPKSKELVLNSVGSELIDFLKPICEECRTYILPRYVLCDMDQHKDVIVVKEGDPRLLPPQELPQEQEERVIRYEYVEQPRDPQPPQDLRNCQFLELNLKKQCFVYQFQFRRSDYWNHAEGLFIRSKMGDWSYELNLDVDKECRELIVEIFPYRKGKLTYEVYIWNSAGFTKSTEELVIYNEMAVPGTADLPLRDYKLYLLGVSTNGLKYCGDMEDTQPLLFGYKGKPHLFRNISLSTAALACCTKGNVAAWGKMYYPTQETQDREYQDDLLELRIETPFSLLQRKYVRKVSCGRKHYLMVTITGSLYSMGWNEYGQLGLGSLGFIGPEATEPQQVFKFSNSQSPFIEDILASPGGASFALNSEGQLYRWGLNQVEETALAIKDRFDSVINYSTGVIIQRCFHPTKVSHRFLPNPIIQIASGEDFHFALDVTGVLYGWGVCKYLGVRQLQDSQERIIMDIVNPIEIMKDVKSITCGFDHAVVVMKDGRVLAWGEASSFSSREDFAFLPVDLTEEYGHDEIVQIKAGKGYTAVLTKDNTIHIHGQRHNFPSKTYKLPFAVTDISCSYESLIGILADS